jgi:GNAT superfamily N-acetyltransferase
VPEFVLEKRYGPAKKAIWNGLRAYNRSRIGEPKHARFAVTVREGDRILGGATAELWANGMFIELLWLDDAVRVMKCGTKVMDLIEDEGRRRGAAFAYVDTFSFQARPFYEKRGYAVFGTLEDFPPGHKRYWLRKTL